MYYAQTSLAKLGRWLLAAAPPSGSALLSNDVSALSAAAAKLKASFNRLLVEAPPPGGGGGGVCDGPCGDVDHHCSVHSSFYALAFGLLDQTNVLPAWESVRDRGNVSPSTHESSQTVNYMEIF